MELSEEHQKYKIQQKHKHTPRMQTHKTGKIPSCTGCLKKHICHVNVFLRLKVYFSFVEEQILYMMQ